VQSTGENFYRGGFDTSDEAAIFETVMIGAELQNPNLKFKKDRKA